MTAEDGSKVSNLYAVLFMIPFVPIGAGMACATLYVWLCQSSLVMDHEKGLFRREILGMKFDRKFAVSEIKAIKRVMVYLQNDVPVHGIGILRRSADEKQEPLGSRLYFGSSLPEDEKEWLLGEIHSFWKEATWIASE